MIELRVVRFTCMGGLLMTAAISMGQVDNFWPPTKLRKRNRVEMSMLLLMVLLLWMRGVRLLSFVCMYVADVRFQLSSM